MSVSAENLSGTHGLSELLEVYDILELVRIRTFGNDRLAGELLLCTIGSKVLIAMSLAKCIAYIGISKGEIMYSPKLSANNP